MDVGRMRGRPPSRGRGHGYGRGRGRSASPTAAFPDLSGFEFFIPILEDSWHNLRLPAKFSGLLTGQEPRELTLREAGGGRGWDVEVQIDGEGRMYLAAGWEQLARAHGLQQGHFLGCTYGREGGVLTVKVFDGTMCLRHYHIDEE